MSPVKVYVISSSQGSQDFLHPLINKSFLTALRERQAYFPNFLYK